MFAVKFRQWPKKAVTVTLTILLTLGTVFFVNNIPASAHGVWQDYGNYGMAFLGDTDKEVGNARDKTIQLERVVNTQQNKVTFTAVFNFSHESWTSPYEYAVLPSDLTNFSMVRYEKKSNGDWSQTDVFTSIDSFSGSGKDNYVYPSSDFDKNFEKYANKVWNKNGFFAEVNDWKNSGKFSRMIMWQTGWNKNAYKWVITMDIPANCDLRKSAIIVGMCSWNAAYPRGAVIGPHYARDKYDVSTGSVTKFYGETLTSNEVLSRVSTTAPGSEVASVLVTDGALPQIGKNKIPVRVNYTDNTYSTAYVDATFVPVVSKYKAQVKFTLDSPSTVEDRYSLRIVSSISAEEWSHYFNNTAVAGSTADRIYSAGIVAYRGSPGDFDLQTAESVIGGAVAENYACAETDYFQKPTAESDALFGAIIKLKHSTAQNDIKYLCWVKYMDDDGIDQLAIYRNVENAPVVSAYDSLVNRYIAAYPY